MLKLQNICFELNNKQILKNINLDLEENQIIVITGHNGSGKTTLVKLLMGIFMPSTGNIYLNDENITKLSISEHANKSMAFAFQSPIKFKGVTVKNLLQTALTEKGKQYYKSDLSITDKNADFGIMCELLSQVGLCAREYINREIDNSLSGGELKRIELATTLARGADINIFDEPEAGIDIWSFDNLLRIFKNLKNFRKGLTIIVSHQEKILEIADKIVVLKSGQIEEIGSPMEILPTLKHQDKCQKLVKGEKDNG